MNQVVIIPCHGSSIVEGCLPVDLFSDRAKVALALALARLMP